MRFVSAHIINPYGKRLLIATPETETDIQEIEEAWSLIDEDNQLGGFHKIEYEGWNASLVIFNLCHKQSISYGMISHEALHVVDDLNRSIGHDYDYQNNEHSAYLIEWIVNEIFKHFSEKNILSKLSSDSFIKE
jgi:hypothetical protein